MSQPKLPNLFTPQIITKPDKTVKNISQRLNFLLALLSLLFFALLVGGSFAYFYYFQ